MAKSILRRLYSVKPENVSKVVDENGEPMVTYHGTNAEFWEFDPELVGENFGIDEEGFFFTDDEVDADNYAIDKANMKEEGEPRTVAALLDIKNPLMVDATADAWSNPDGAPNTFYDERKGDLLRKMRDGKHDGVIVRGVNGQKMFVALNPIQIKSATDNVGTFSERPDIRFSRGDENRFEVTPEEAAAIRALDIHGGKNYLVGASQVARFYTQHE